MTIRPLRAAGFAVLMTAIALPALAADADPVVATVNGHEIHRSTVEEAQRGIPQLRQVPFEMVYNQLLDHVITTHLLLDQAKKQNLESDPAVKAAFKDAQNRILEQAYLAKQVEKDISDAQIRKQYDELKQHATGKEEVKVRHILVDSEDAAKAVIADLKSGVSFEEEAKAKSKDTASKANGGELGYITEGETVPEFSAAAFKLKPGEYTQTPVKTQFGWHIIKVEDRRPAQPPTYAQAKDAIRNELAQKDVQKIIERLHSGAHIKRFNSDGSPMTETPKK